MFSLVWLLGQPRWIAIRNALLPVAFEGTPRACLFSTSCALSYSSATPIYRRSCFELVNQKILHSPLVPDQPSFSIFLFRYRACKIQKILRLLFENFWCLFSVVRRGFCSVGGEEGPSASFGVSRSTRRIPGLSVFFQCKLVLEGRSFGRAFAQTQSAAYLCEKISQLAQMATALHSVVQRAHPRLRTASRSKNPAPFSMPFVAE